MCLYNIDTGCSTGSPKFQPFICKSRWPEQMATATLSPFAAKNSGTCVDGCLAQRRQAGIPTRHKETPLSLLAERKLAEARERCDVSSPRTFLANSGLEEGPCVVGESRVRKNSSSAHSVLSEETLEAALRLRLQRDGEGRGEAVQARQAASVRKRETHCKHTRVLLSLRQHRVSLPFSASRAQGLAESR